MLWATCSPKLNWKLLRDAKLSLVEIKPPRELKQEGENIVVKFGLLLVIYINAFGKYIVFKELIFITVHAFLESNPTLT